LATQGKTELAQERGDICEGSPQGAAGHLLCLWLRRLVLTLPYLRKGFPTPCREKSKLHRRQPLVHITDLHELLFKAESSVLRCFSTLSSCDPSSLPHQCFPLVQQVPSLTHPSAFLASPKSLEARVEERVRERVPRGGQQGTPVRYAGGKKVVTPLPASSYSTYIAVKAHPSANRADSFTAAV